MLSMYFIFSNNICNARIFTYRYFRAISYNFYHVGFRDRYLLCLPTLFKRKLACLQSNHICCYPQLILQGSIWLKWDDPQTGRNKLDQFISVSIYLYANLYHPYLYLQLYSHIIHTHMYIRACLFVHVHIYMYIYSNIGYTWIHIYCYIPYICSYVLSCTCTFSCIKMHPNKHIGQNLYVVIQKLSVIGLFLI